MRQHVLYPDEDFTVTDMFCGAGGSSSGASKVPGVSIAYAINHDQYAIETHNTNFPKTTHVKTDVQVTSPDNFERTDMLIASPSCTNHSIAKGRKKGVVALQPELPWDGDEDREPLPLSVEERSRCTMWEPLRWTRKHQYRYIILENVVDVTGWQYYSLWLSEWGKLGYNFRVLYLNSMHFPWVPQSRDRWYFVAWRKGEPEPDLSYYPKAYCPTCEQIVSAVQSWKNPRKQRGRYGKHRQYLYRCPKCTNVVEPYYACAASAIDWSIPAQRIGDRKKPLKPKTLKRVEEGLRRFQSAEPFTLQVNKTTNRYVRVDQDPMPTQTCDNGQALVTPYVFGLNHGARYKNVMSDPLFTQTTYDETCFVVPNAHVLDLLEEYRLREITGPISTICARGNHQALVTYPFIAELRGGGSDARSITEALATVCASGNHHALVMPPAFLSTFYKHGQNVPVTQAMPTATTHDRHGLVTVNGISIEECGFRMLEASEIKRAMAFAEDYVLLGSRRIQVRLAGNAVTPPVMEFLVGRCAAAGRR